MSTLKDLAFSIAEYRSRVKQVQEAIADQALDALLCHSFPNICYLTGFQSIGLRKYYLVLIPATGEPTLLCQDFEMHNALVTAWTDDRVTYGVRDDYIAATQRLLLDRGLAGKRLGVEVEALKASDYLRLRDAIPNATFVDVSGTVENIRSIKSPAEIEYIRQAARLTSAGMQAAIEVTAEGVTDNDIATAAYQAIIGGGSEYMCYAPIVTVGERSGIPHTTHRRRTVRRGDVVFMEFGACFHRYSAPLMRTVAIGPISDMVKRMTAACINCVNTVIDNIKPGVPGAEVAAKADKVWEAVTGNLIWHGSYCYSVGLGFPPEWNDSPVGVRVDDETILQAGMVFHCTTSLRDVGKYGTTFSETIVVTNDGWEVLTDAPRGLVVK